MPARYLAQPISFRSTTGQTTPALRAIEDPDLHLRDKILAILFTAPGERVNRPEFGVGLNRVVFEGLHELTLAALEFRISDGLQRDIGDDILLDGIDLSGDPSAGELQLIVNYRRRADRVPLSLQMNL